MHCRVTAQFPALLKNMVPSLCPFMAVVILEKPHSVSWLKLLLSVGTAVRMFLPRATSV